MKKNYYVSRYLNIISLSNYETVLLFNGVNGCLDEVPLELGRILSTHNRHRLNALSDDNLNLLEKRGHITVLPPEIELTRFKEFVTELHKRQIEHIPGGGILLIPSYSCNLDCKYCFQKARRADNVGKVMSPELLDAIFERHITTLLPRIQNPCLSLFGGEPFLPANETVVRKALEHAKRRKMTTVAVTNGTKIDLMLDIFGPELGKVNKLQISFDGARSEHNKSRVPTNGEETFGEILSNVKLLLSKKVHVDIRINIDRTKLETLPQLVEELRSNTIIGNPYAYVYAYPLHEAIGNVDTSEFIGFEVISQRIKELGLKMECPCVMRGSDANRLLNLTHGLGLTRTAYCMQTSQNYVVVDPFGDIYACSEEAGYPEYRVGHINNERVEFFPLRETYKSRHLGNLPECLCCSVALACGGQCGLKCRVKTGNLFKIHCDGLKRTILSVIKQEYESKTSKKSSQ